MKTEDELRAVADDHYLSLMALRIFRAGLKHSVVDAKWPAFEDAFFGFYPVREHVINLGGTPRAIYDLMGKDAILFHHSVTDDDTSTGSQYVEQARDWFESMWSTVSTEFVR